jgi:hypothetical protein
LIISLPFFADKLSVEPEQHLAAKKAEKAQERRGGHGSDFFRVKRRAARIWPRKGTRIQSGGRFLQPRWCDRRVSFSAVRQYLVSRAAHVLLPTPPSRESKRQQKGPGRRPPNIDLGCHARAAAG